MQLNNYHILLLSGWYYSDSVSGTELYIHSIRKGLQVLGLEVTIAAPSNDEADTCDIVC